MDKTLIVVAGPTAVGKTATAIRLAQRYGAEIVSADSRQCYREMSIGTAKPTPQELDQVKHYFINSHSVEEELSAADYESLALGYCSAAFSRSGVAIACGGTGLYIKALCDGLDPMPPVDADIEAAIQEGWEKHGIDWLRESVRLEDPMFYEQGETQNPMRLMRALSFKRSVGSSILDYRTGSKKDRDFKVIKIGLELPRPFLYQRIDERVLQMMQMGLVEEVRSLNEYRGNKNLQTVGYRELFDYLDGAIPYDKAVLSIQQHTRNYAKRQMTWFKRDSAFAWFAPDQLAPIQEYIDKMI